MGVPDAVCSVVTVLCSAAGASTDHLIVLSARILALSRSDLSSACREVPA